MNIEHLQSKKTTNWLKTMSLASLLLIGMSCSTDEDIVEVTTVKETVTLAGKLNTAFQAEDFDEKSDELIKAVGGTKVGYIKNGSWIKFDDFDHSGATSVVVTASSGTSGGTIQFRKGSATGGNLLAEVDVDNTGGWNNMEEFSADITGSSSNSDLYVVFTGGSGYLLDIDSFEFTNGSSSGGTDNGSSGTTNLALSGTAEQSSNYSSSLGLANLAIDGDTNGNWSNRSVTHTQTTYQPWWQVRLGNDTNIEEIVVWNRTNCCMDRLSNFDVFVYNSSGSQVFKTTITGTPNPSETISTGGVTGNRVRIKLKGTNPLSLAEVQVFGEATDDGGGTDPGDGGGNTGDTPYEALGLDRWKITLPKDEGGDSDADEVFYYKSDNDHSGDDALTDYSDEFFYVSSSGNVVFECPADYDLPKTSSGTSNTRTELREMPYRSGNEDGWDAGGSTVREMSMRVRVMQTSSTRKLAFAQIHDYGEDNWDDLIRIQIQSDDENATVGDTGKIYIMGDMAEGLDSEGVDGEDSDDRTILSNYTLGDWMDIRVTYNNDTIRIYLDGTEVKEYTGADCPSNYFKAGCYNQSMSSSSNGTGIVEIQSLSVSSNF